MAIKFKTLVAASVVAIGTLAGAGEARAQLFVPPNGNPGPFPPPVVCRHIGPCHCPRPWYPGYGYGYGYPYGYGWGYRPGSGYRPGWGYGYVRPFGFDGPRGGHVYHRGHR